MLGYRKVPVIIRVMRDDEAVIAMIDANNQREEISISEKAFAYKMKYEALRRRSERQKQKDNNPCSLIGYRGKRTVQILGEEGGDSPKQVQRYLRIPELIPEDPSFPHIALREKLILIGSLPGAVDIVLKAPAVSRIHARIIKKGEDYYITDLHSKNGTMVNEMSIDNETEKLLENDDRIRFANVSYTVSGICPA